MRSYRPSTHDRGVVAAWNRSSTPLFRAFSPATSTPFGSTSIPSVNDALRRAAAIPRIPVPVPMSSTRRGAGTAAKASSRSWRHICVVSCVPVPNACPGSMVRTISSGAGEYGSHDGLTVIRLPILLGLKCSFHCSAQPKSVISAAETKAPGSAPNERASTGRKSRNSRFTVCRSASQGK